MLKIAMVGVGGITGAHIPAWDAMPDAELGAICDIRPQRMEPYPDKRHYLDFDEMLEKEEIDILDVCLPTYLHVEFVLKALNKGINVLCEKPISLNKEDVKIVYEAAEKNNVKFMVAHVIRFWPEYEVVKKIYDERKYGKLLSGNMSRLSQIPSWSWDNWMFDEDRSGLVPFDLHIHDFDFLVYAFGAPKNFKSYRSKLPEQDYFNAIYQFDGFFVSTEASWYKASYPFTVGFRFQFENAVVEWKNNVLTVYECDGKKYNPIGAVANDTGDIGLPPSNAYANEIRYFANCVINDTMPEKVKPDELETVIEILKNL